MFNHFPNNSELTTKAGLMKNLYCKASFSQLIFIENTEAGTHVDSFYPRSFDLSDLKQ